MITTVGEILQRIQSQYSKGVQSDDSRLTERHIYSVAISARSILLTQKATRNQMISQWEYQTLPCVELERAKQYECDCVPDNKCIILKTKHTLPKPVAGLDNMLVKYVTSLDGSVRFDPDDFENIKYANGNKFTHSKPNYYFKNGRLFVTVLKLLEGLTITGLFHDPLEVKQFPSLCPCDGCECFDVLEMEFPIDGKLITPLVQLASKELIVMFKQMGEDKSNNASDDAASTGSMVHQPQGEE